MQLNEDANRAGEASYRVEMLADAQSKIDEEKSV
jgi:hypothetical protein